MFECLHHPRREPACLRAPIRPYLYTNLLLKDERPWRMQREWPDIQAMEGGVCYDLGS